MAQILFRHKPIEPKPDGETSKYGERWRGALMHSVDKLLKANSDKTEECLRKAIEKHSAELQANVTSEVDALKLLFFIQIIMNISLMGIYVAYIM